MVIFAPDPANVYPEYPDPVSCGKYHSSHSLLYLNFVSCLSFEVDPFYILIIYLLVMIMISSLSHKHKHTFEHDFYVIIGTIIGCKQILNSYII